MVLHSSFPAALFLHNKTKGNSAFLHEHLSLFFFHFFTFALIWTLYKKLSLFLYSFFKEIQVVVWNKNQ